MSAMLSFSFVLSMLCGLVAAGGGAIAALRGIDADEDGTLSHSEIERAFRLAQRRRHRDERQRLLQRGAAAEAEALFLNLSTPNDGSARYVYPSNIRTRGVAPSALTERLELHRWRFADADADGKLDSGEFLSYLRPELAVDEQALARWRAERRIIHMDADGDGVLAWVEYQQGQRKVLAGAGTDAGADADADADADHFQHCGAGAGLVSGLRSDSEVACLAAMTDPSTAESRALHVLQVADRDGDGALDLRLGGAEDETFAGSVRAELERDAKLATEEEQRAAAERQEL